MQLADALLDGLQWLRRQWWLVLCAVGLGAVLGGGLGWWRTPSPEYRATAMIRFASGPAELTSDLPAAGSRIDPGTVTSLPIVEEVARRLNMVPVIEDPELRKTAQYLSVLQRLQARIQVQSVPGALVVSAVADRPEAAAQMATATAEASVREGKRWRDQQWVGVKRIYEAQLVGAEHRLREAEQDLREFREREGPVLYAEEAKASLDAIIWLEREQEELQRGKAEAVRLEQTAKLQGIRAQEGVLARQLAKARERYAKLPKVAAELARLERAIKVEGEAFESLKNRVDRLMVIGAQLQNEQIEVEPAALPTAPMTPRCVRAWFLWSGLIGLALGILAALWREASATSLRTIDGVQASLKLPVLGVLPRYRERALRAQVGEQYATSLPPEGVAIISNLFAVGVPHSIQAEGIRSVQANLEFAVGDAPVKVLTVTSAGTSEGKTLTTVNLAVALAQEGRRILLVDADSLRPTVHERLGLSRDPGLADVLGGAVPWRSAVQSVTDLMLGPVGVDPILRSPRLDNLWVLPAGSQAVTRQPLPAAKLAVLLREMRDEYDLVMVDTPAILPLLDAVRVSAKADGTILVFPGGAGGFPALKRAKFLLDHARAKILGLVLTNVGPEAFPESAAYGYDGK